MADDGLTMHQTASEILNKHRIVLRSSRSGNQTTTCPQCSAGRKKKKDPCLSVKIDALGVRYFCHHCGHQGGEYFDQGRGEMPKRQFNRREPVRNPYADLQRSSSSGWR